MKLALFVCGMMLATAAVAQSASKGPAKRVLHPKPAAAPAQSSTNTNVTDQSFQFRAPGQPGLTLPSFSLKPVAPNEIIRGKLTYSGVAVEAFKTKRPLQLLNPLAPPQYGGPEENLARDPINHRVEGLKLFAIHF